MVQPRFRFGMVKLQLGADINEKRRQHCFRFGMVKLQLVTYAEGLATYHVGFRFGMVKLQRGLYRATNAATIAFPLWHGKVATYAHLEPELQNSVVSALAW